MDEPKKQNTGMAVVAYILFFVPLLTNAKNDPFVKFHVKQGLTLFICWVVAVIISMIPLIGWIISFVIDIALLVLFVIGIINVLHGEERPLPIIGEYAKKFNF